MARAGACRRPQFCFAFGGGLHQPFGTMAFLSVAYRETITRPAEARGKFVRSGPDRPRYGDIAVRVEPMHRGGGFEVVNAMEPGRIPVDRVPDAVQGIYETAEEGILAGFPLVDVRVVLTDGTFHAHHSSALSFRIASSIALRDAVLAAEPVVLAPVAKLEIPVPRAALHQLQREISRMKGLVVSSEEYDHDRFRVRVVVGLANLVAAEPGAVNGNTTPPPEGGQTPPSGMATVFPFNWQERFSLMLSHYEQADPELQRRLVAEHRHNLGE